MIERMNDGRTAAVYILGRCRKLDAWSTQLLESAAKRFKLEKRELALCARIVKTVLQNARFIDYYAGHYCTQPLRKLEPKVLDVIRVGAAQVLFMDRIPVSAAVNESVRLIKDCGITRASGLVNAVLHRIAENREHLPAIIAESPAAVMGITFSEPDWLCNVLVEERGSDFASDFFHHCNREPFLGVSVNLLKTSREEYISKLKAAGINAFSYPDSQLSVVIADNVPITELPGYDNGDFFVQDPAAAVSVEMAGPFDGKSILDGCSAPGGKSMGAYSLSHGNCRIVSCDIHEKKLGIIRENAKRLGFSQISVCDGNAAFPKPDFYSSFDVVIADVPCSGIGVIRKKPEIRYKTKDSVEALPAVQLKILNGLAQCVKPGGILLYSTCTVLKAENELLIDAFLSEHDNFILEKQRIFWPNVDGTDGFFACRLCRKR